ncbi:MAG: phytoene/squalene synthase family protein [Verrucomicrobiales bacterium]|nr:phytoene/squalene synthase family protein [Verrucomicrobiales bacterium]
MDLVNATSLEIVRRSGSNLAFALAVLPREKRDDMRVFYAFCRVADDLADEPGLSEEVRTEGLARWRRLIRGEDDDPGAGIESELVELQRKRDLDADELEAIIDGVEKDLNPQSFETREDLMGYCYLVASAVGLVSIRLFGCRNPESKVYAEQLGYALQWTNIMRDVGEDAREGRVFLPGEDLARFGLSKGDILAGNPDKACFQRLMKHECKVAREFYEKAVNALPDEDRKSMRSAELMRRMYSRILEKMEADGYDVFAKRYKLSKPRMIAEFLRAKIFG